MIDLQIAYTPIIYVAVHVPQFSYGHILQIVTILQKDHMAGLYNKNVNH